MHTILIVDHLLSLTYHSFYNDHNGNLTYPPEFYNFNTPSPRIIFISNHCISIVKTMIKPLIQMENACINLLKNKHQTLHTSQVWYKLIVILNKQTILNTWQVEFNLTWFEICLGHLSKTNVNSNIMFVLY